VEDCSTARENVIRKAGLRRKVGARGGGEDRISMMMSFQLDERERERLTIYSLSSHLSRDLIQPTLSS